MRASHRTAYFKAFCALMLASACSKSPKRDAPMAIATAVDAAPLAVASAVPSDAIAAVDASLGSPSPPDAIVREEAKLTLDGAEESWRLEWRHPPVPECMGDDWYTCPCNGFQLGEKGDLDLVRTRANAPEDRLALNSLFEDRDAKLPRWPPLASEKENLTVPSQAALQKRALVPIMKLGDYDHDGRASEFVLQIAAFPCGHQTSVVVGIDKKNTKLHVFTSIESSKDWITLESPSDWEKVRTRLPVTLTEWSCGDHGSEDEETVVVSVDWAGLHAKHTKKKCEGQ